MNAAGWPIVTDQPDAVPSVYNEGSVNILQPVCSTWAVVQALQDYNLQLHSQTFWSLMS